MGEQYTRVTGGGDAIDSCLVNSFVVDEMILKKVFGERWNHENNNSEHSNNNEDNDEGLFDEEREVL